MKVQTYLKFVIVRICERLVCKAQPSWLFRTFSPGTRYLTCFNSNGSIQMKLPFRRFFIHPHQVHIPKMIFFQFHLKVPRHSDILKGTIFALDPRHSSFLAIIMRITIMKSNEITLKVHINTKNNNYRLRISGSLLASAVFPLG